MLPGGFVGDLREFADQLLEHQAHLHVVYRIRMQVDLGEAFGHLVEQPAFVQAVNLGKAVEALENIAHRQGEALNIAVEVLADMVGIAHQLGHVQRRDVVEALPGLAQQEGLGVGH
ncbi:hypothetical protein D9M70_614280 [compost metagenome]